MTDSAADQNTLFARVYIDDQVIIVSSWSGVSNIISFNNKTYLLGTSVAKKFREANLHVTTSGNFNFAGDLTPDDEMAFVHWVLSPELYKYGTGSYYSESEYTMTEGRDILEKID